MTKITRRKFIIGSVAAGVTFDLAANASTLVPTVLGSAAADRLPLSKKVWANVLATREVPYAGLVTSLHEENRYDCEIEGALPEDLRGQLYRVGPGIFERGDQRRRLQIDCDGMIRRFKIDAGKVEFSNRHIRTEKFVQEEKANRYLYPSLGMLVPATERFFTNSLARLKNQASVTAFCFGKRLFVTDEIQPLTELDPETLSTLPGSDELTDGRRSFMAHYRITEGEKKLLHLAAFEKMTGDLQVLSYDENYSRVSETRAVKVPQSFHDWHVTANYFVFVLPPAYRTVSGLARAMAGMATIADAIEFRDHEKTRVLVVPRDGTPAKFLFLPVTLDTWHTVNAFEPRDSEIIIDFIGATRGEPAVSNRSSFTKIMRGEIAVTGELRQSRVCRARLDLRQGKVEFDDDYFSLPGTEMPTIDQRRYGLDYDSAFFIAGQEGIDSRLVGLNVKSGRKDWYDFGPGQFVTEPIFAPGKTGDRGYLLSEVYHHPTQRSYLAVMDALDLARGPLARVWLRHHLPSGFHGHWST